ncbi:PAS domain S-box protein [Lysobacter sp. TY2-98]|uniref:ATP-binding protein n=1 Tax=Lysobacter sp. TY2-98 TaxID=2290922 RepID=UPI000E1FF5B1|nr:ATP-binding protein [Lysobacter sp. TY2-98]AXK71056.1 PAS domain S-box protein [Lysobacter sp. TY2-98]
MHTALFDAIPDALVIVDDDGRILMANRMAYRLFGYEAPALVGRSVEQLIPPELSDQHRRHRRGFRRQPRERAMGQAHMALMGCRQDGSQFPVQIALNPLHLGEHMQVLASIRDVSDTPMAQRVQRRSIHDAALAVIGPLIVGTGEVGQILNEVARELSEAMGVGPVWVLTRDSRGIRRCTGIGLTAPPDDWLAAQSEALFASLEPGQVVRVEGDRLGAATPPEGMRSGLAYPLLLADGTAAAALTAFSRDIEAFDSDAEQLLQTTATMLSSMLQRQRSAEALAHAQRLEAIGKLTGGVAHDFNNLLTVISGNLQMLEAHVSDEGEPRELLAAALRAADQGASLTRKLLSFAGKQRLRPMLISLGREMRELERLARATLGERIRLTVHAAADLPPVRVDSSMLDSVVLNLILNARDAIDGAGEVSVTISDEWIAGDGRGPLPQGRYIALAVRDTGCGMTEEVLAHAWEPFYTTKASGHGTGLGLSMVYGFIRQSGGHVHLQSAPGRGTTVTLYLPAASEQEAAGITAPEVVVGGNEIVLVVEDDDAVRATVEGMLKSLGYHVIATPSPEAALECVETLGDIRLLFSDLTLEHEMTGAQLGHEARRVRPDVAVLLTSGHPDAAVRDGLDRFTLLPKPYRREELARAVRAALSEQIRVEETE